MLGLWSKLEDGEFPFSLTKDLGVNLVFTQRANGLQTGTHVQRWMKKEMQSASKSFFFFFLLDTECNFWPLYAVQL